MNSSTTRKRRTTVRSLASKPKTSRTSNTRGTRDRATSMTDDKSAERVAALGDPAPETETIDVMDNTEDSVQEIVDLTCEGAEAVVDLTNNDSVLLVEEGPCSRNTATGQSYVLSSDEDEDSPAAFQATMSPANTFRTPGSISCPICLDSYSEITESGRLVVSSRCGHVFCSQCLRDALTSSHTCPTCRKRLNHRQYHPLYI